VPRFGAAGTAGRAPFRSGDIDRAADSDCGFSQVQVNRYPDVAATLRAPPAHAAKTAKSTPEELLENVIEAPEVAEEIARTELLPTIERGASLWVGKNLVGLGNLPKPRFGRRIIRIGIGMGIPG
jgi:hypothetical protein